MDRLDVRLPARPATIPALREAVVAFARDCGHPDPHSIGLAVTEAATNAIVHAYPDGDEGEVRLVACAEPDRLVIVVRDWGPGPGLQPRPDSPGMGLGLPTIAALADEFRVERADGAGTLLRMHFPRATDQAA